MTDSPIDTKHNNPPEDLPYDIEVYEDFEKRIEDFNSAVGEFLDLGKIENADQAARLNDTITGARQLYKQVEDARRAQKKPYDDQADIVHGAFNKLKNRIDAIATKPKALSADWLKREQDRKNAERAEELRRAREEQQKLEDLKAKAAARNDVAGEADVEAELEKVQRATSRLEKKPNKARVGSATGGARTQSLRKIKKGRITHFGRVVNHYRDHPKLVETLEKLINADIRATDVDHTKIPGIEIYEEETV